MLVSSNDINHTSYNIKITAQRFPADTVRISHETRLNDAQMGHLELDLSEADTWLDPSGIQTGKYEQNEATIWLGSLCSQRW